MKKELSILKLFRYVGKFKYLIIILWVLFVVSVFMVLILFVFIWKIIKEVLNVLLNFSGVRSLIYYGWMVVFFFILLMVIYIGVLFCFYIVVFCVQVNIRLKVMYYIVILLLGFMDGIGSGKIRKIVNEFSVVIEIYLVYQLLDCVGVLVIFIGFLVMFLVFDYCLGFLSLILVVVVFGIMLLMIGNRMQEKMKEYQNLLE